MEYEKVKDKFGTWAESFREYIESESFNNIFKFLKTEVGKGKTIIPKSQDIFRSFSVCDMHKLKAVIVLMDPYPTLREKVMIANGIPMDCSNTGYLQSSLEMWYNGIENTYGFNPNLDMRANISYLLEEEHVLLINSSLSVEMSKVGSHSETWRSFMQHLFKILNENHKGLPIILCGTAAQKYEKDINPLLHYILKCEHPVAASYANRTWDYKDMFQWTNRILESNNGPEYKIKWYREKGEGKKALPAPWDEPDTSTVKAVRSIDKEWETANKMPWE